MRFCSRWWIAAALCCDLGAQTRMEIVVEKKRGDEVEAMNPGHVFETGDLVRFRFRMDSAGYLYVMNYSTSEKYALLFPKEDGGENVIEQSKEYVIPATSGGWFRIAGPAGQDIVYWMLAPTELTRARPVPSDMRPPGRPSGSPATVTPRCDDTIFRARGDCVDPTAGVKPGSDRLSVDRRGDRSIISSFEPLARPVIYEFRVAHRGFAEWRLPRWLRPSPQRGRAMLRGISTFTKTATRPRRSRF